MQSAEENTLCPEQRNFIQTDSEATKKFPSGVGSLHLTSSFALLHELVSGGDMWHISHMNYKLKGPGLLLTDITTRHVHIPIFKDMAEEADEDEGDAECPEEMEQEIEGFWKAWSMSFYLDWPSIHKQIVCFHFFIVPALFALKELSSSLKHFNNKIFLYRKVARNPGPKRWWRRFHGCANFFLATEILRMRLSTLHFWGSQKKATMLATTSSTGGKRTHWNLLQISDTNPKHAALGTKQSTKQPKTVWSLFGANTEGCMVKGFQILLRTFWRNVMPAAVVLVHFSRMWNKDGRQSRHSCRKSRHSGRQRRHSGRQGSRAKIHLRLRHHLMNIHLQNLLMIRDHLHLDAGCVEKWFCLGQMQLDICENIDPACNVDF